MELNAEKFVWNISNNAVFIGLTCKSPKILVFGGSSRVLVYFLLSLLRPKSCLSKTKNVKKNENKKEANMQEWRMHICDTTTKDVWKKML